MGKRKKVKWKDAKRMIKHWYEQPRNYDCVQADASWGERNRAEQARRELQRRREVEIAKERAQACLNARRETVRRIHWDADDDGLSAFRGCMIALIIAATISLIILLIKMMA